VKAASGRGPASLYVPVGPGELIDKITILEIKAEHIAARGELTRNLAQKAANISVELAELCAARSAAIAPSLRLDKLTASLKLVNQTLWWVEDELRACEHDADFGPCFVALARSVYRLNDQRAALKRQINDLLDAVIVEEKLYAAY
jgi:hypothetical protein